TIGRRLVAGFALVVLLGLISLVAVRPAAAAGACGPPGASVVAGGDTKPGGPPGEWLVGGEGDTSIQGFATQMSVAAGQTVSFKVSTPSRSYHIDILRVGWYQGSGATKVVSGLVPSASLPQSQPACRNDTGPTGLVDCGNWAVS